MSLKTRLAKLEAIQALKNKPIEEYDSDGSELAETIRRINANALLGLPREPWVICPPPDETDIQGAHLHRTMNRIAEKEQREREQKKQSKKSNTEAGKVHVD